MEIVYMCILWITEGRNTSCNPLCPQTQFFNENRLKHRVGICWLLPEVNTPALQVWKAAVKCPWPIYMCVWCGQEAKGMYIQNCMILNLLSIPPSGLAMSNVRYHSIQEIAVSLMGKHPLLSLAERLRWSQQEIHSNEQKNHCYLV